MVDVATIEAPMRQDEFILGALFVVEMKLRCLGDDVVVALELLLPNFEHPFQVVLDHGYLFAQSVDLDHFLEIVPKMIVIFLRVLVVYP